MVWQTDIATKIAELIGYHFKNVDLLNQALTRKSAILEHKQHEAVGHNETLATLGDGLLRAVIDDILMEIKPDYAKGELSPQRDELVNNIKLAKIAQEINLDLLLMMGKGELKNYHGPGRNKILATSLEALIGAIFRDSERNYLIIKRFIIKHWALQHTYRREYSKLLIEAIIKQDEKAVEYLLAVGIDPNTSTDPRDSLPVKEARFYKYKFNKELKDSAWGRDEVTFFCEGITSGTALQHALLTGYLVVPPIIVKSRFYIENGSLYFNPFYIETPLSDILDSIFYKDLTLAPYHPAYDLLKIYFTMPVLPYNVQIIKLLLQHGADPNKAALSGQTALHTAAYRGDIEIVKLLLEHKADLTIADKEGNLPQSSTNNKEILTLLAPLSATATKSNEKITLRNRFFKSETLSHDDHDNAYTTTKDDNSYGCYIL